MVFENPCLNTKSQKKRNYVKLDGIIKISRQKRLPCLFSRVGPWGSARNYTNWILWRRRRLKISPSGLQLWSRLTRTPASCALQTIRLYSLHNYCSELGLYRWVEAVCIRLQFPNPGLMRIAVADWRTLWSFFLLYSRTWLHGVARSVT